MKLVFVGDPMCSWCYGFAKVNISPGYARVDQLDRALSDALHMHAAA